MPLSSAEPTIPAVHVLQLIEVVKRWQVTGRELTSGLGLQLGQLGDPKATVTVPQLVAVLERARSLTAEPGIGVYLGLQTRATGHGYLGFAAMSAPTFGDAIALAIRYVPIRTTAIELRGHVEGQAAVLTIEEHADFGSARDIVLCALLIGLRQVGCALTGREVDLAMDFAIPEPGYFSRFAHALTRARFNQPANRLTGRAGGLSSPLLLADPEGLRISREQCERLLESLGLDGRIAARARSVLSDAAGFRTLEQTARELGLSSRTLRRRLDAEGTSFADLLADERRQRALTLLRSAELSVDEIAAKLGYTDPANFTRAFQRWTGQSPSAFRKSSGRP